MERIFIFDGKNEQLVAVAGGSNEGTMPVTSAPFTEQLNKDFTLEVSVPANHTDAQYVVEGNIVGYLDLDGNLQAFNIFKVEDVHNGDTLQRVAYAEHVFYELLDDVVEDQRAYGVDATTALTKALSASRWQVGTVASLGTGDTNFYYNNALNNVREIVNTYGGELNFRLTYNNGAITGRYVDLLARRGADTGKRFEYTKDIDSIKRTVDSTDIKTALYGRGKSTQIEATGGYTRKADFADVVWATPTNPINKPAGQEWVGDTTALALYGRIGNYVNLGTMFFDTGYDTYVAGQSYNFTVSAGWTTDWDNMGAVVGDAITNNNVIESPVFEITAINGYNLTVKALVSITDGSPAQWSGEYVVRRNKRHRFGIVEFSEIEDPTALLQATWDYLQTVNKPRLTYEITAIDLERVSGLDHEKVRLGDTVFIIDRDLNLTVEARVIELKRDAVDPTVSTVVLGNFIPLFVDIATKLDDVSKKLSEKEGIWDNAGSAVDDTKIVIEAPATPTNASASGLFETINVKWDFDPSIKVAGYEVYASQVNNFTADSSNLVWRGKAGGINLTVAPNQTWYFRVLAFNPAGTKSALTAQFSATTAKITGTYIADATIGNAHIKDVSADKLTAGTIDANVIDVVNVNADNINAGKLKAQYVEIGSQTTFNTGYDPTKLTVGGINLVTGTKDGAGWVGGFVANGNELSMDNSSTSAETYFYSPYFDLEGGVEVTLTFEAKTTTNVKSFEVYALPDDYSTTGLVNYQLIVDGLWRKYKFTFTTPTGWGNANDPNQVRLRFDNNGTTDANVSTIYVRKVKLERGNMATDWSVAPADVDNAIGDAMETVTTEYNTAITNSATDITLDVNKTLYGDTNDPNNTGGLKGEMQRYTDGKVTLTETNFNIQFTDITKTTDDHEDKLAEVYSYFDFSASGLNIGKSDSPLQINISNSEMDFIDNGQIVAYVNGQKMYIDSLEVLTNVIVGNHKIEKYDTNITLVKWVGE